MDIPNCYDPVVQEEDRQLAYTAKRMRMPRCLCCNEHIWTEKYLDLSAFGLNGYACEECVKHNQGYSDDLEN